MSRLAWFRPAAPDADDLLDDTAQLIGALGSRYAVELIGARRAHDVVWKHARHPYDIFVYELDDTPGHQYIWPYLLHYPGVTLLRRMTVQASRMAALERERRAGDAAREAAFDLGQGEVATSRGARAIVRVSPMLRAPLAASRVCVVPHAAVADALLDRYPDARISTLPIAVSAAPATMPASERCTFGVILTGDSRDRVAVVHRAFERAFGNGRSAELIVDADARHVLARSHVVLALQWPTLGAPLQPAIAGMAARRAVVVLDTIETADWPSLDPQTWRERRSIAADPPICVSLDLRDEEHSLMLAMRRLAADPPLGERLAAAGQVYWSGRHAPARVAPRFEQILLEASTAAPPPLPAGWPAHLRADGTTRAREILRDIGASVDIF